MDQTRQLVMKSHLTDTQTQRSHQPTSTICQNRPNEPMDHKIPESAYERKSLIIMVMCYPYYIIGLTNNGDGSETMKDYG